MKRNNKIKIWFVVSGALMLALTSIAVLYSLNFLRAKFNAAFSAGSSRVPTVRFNMKDFDKLGVSRP